MSPKSSCKLESNIQEPSEFIYGNIDVVWRICLSLVLGVSMISSLIGNACTCAVIIREKTMRTPTNLYLFNLAVTDFAVSLFVPIELYLWWSLNYNYMENRYFQFQYLIWDLLCNCNVLTILTFTIERYLVITKPFLRQKLGNKKRICVIISINWIISGIFAVFNICYVLNFAKKPYVYWFSSIPEKNKAFFVAFSMLVFFVIPMLIIIILYILIAINLKSKKSTAEPKSRYRRQSRSKAVKLLGKLSYTYNIMLHPILCYVCMYIHSSS